MELSEYLQDNNLTQKAFSEVFKPKVSQGLVNQWLLWLREPHHKNATEITWERAVEIEAATANAVTRHDIRPDIFGEAA